MKKMNRMSILWLGMAGLMLSVCALSAAEEVNIPDDICKVSKCRQAPVIDGKLNDAAWKRPPAYSTFFSHRDLSKMKPVKDQTKVYITFDDKNLYVAFDCALPKGNPIRCRTFRSRDVYFLDDEECVEFLVDPLGSGRSYYHFGVNANGALWDAFHMMDFQHDLSWDAKGIQWAVWRGKGKWCVEMAVPFKDLGMEPDANIIWRVNCTRMYIVPWQASSNLSGWSSLTGYAIKGSVFRSIRFDVPGRIKGLKKVSLGAVAEKWNVFDGNVFEVEADRRKLGLQRGSELSASVRRISPGKETFLGKATSAKGTDDIVLKVPYKVVGDEGETIRFRIATEKNKPLFDKTVKVYNPTSPFALPSDPLYAELLSDEPAGIISEGLPMWYDTIYGGLMKPFCTSYGIELDVASSFQEIADHAIVPLNSQVLVERYRFPEFSRRMGARCTVWPMGFRGTRNNLFMEPQASAFERESLRFARTPHVWAIFWGDEVRSASYRNVVRTYEGIWKAGDGEKRTEYVRTKLNAKVKAETGYGKYGIPQGRQDADPFRWIAWMRYVNAETRRIQSGIQQKVREINPFMRYISESPSGVFKPYEWSRNAEAGTCDIYHHQAMPEDCGHITKALADLTGMDTYPRVIVHHYSRSASTEETREILSRVFRDGGSGFVIYNGDDTADDTYVQTLSLSAPERWNAILEIGDRIRRQPKLRYPKPDCGVFYCDTSYQALPSFIYYWRDGEVKGAYGILGPDGLRSWFRYVDDNIVLNRSAELSGFKALFIPFAKYQLPGMIEKIEAYAMAGGSVFCCDPEGFTWAADGTSLDEKRKQLFGVEVGKVIDGVKEMIVKDGSLLGVAPGTRLPVLSPAHAIKPLPGTRTLAVFDNGMPAILERTAGKGRTVYFASNPMTLGGGQSEAWRKLFRGTAKVLGIKLDQDIWRFTFPPYERELYPHDPKGVCLTDNYQRFVNDIPAAMHNLDTGGTYTLIPGPDRTSDEGGKKDVAFAKGDLTDRRDAYACNKARWRPKNKWQVRWKENVPVEAVFDFKQSYPVQGVRVFYTGQMPRFKVYVSRDGRKWEEAAQMNKEQYNYVVGMAACTFTPRSARYVKLAFEKSRKDFIDQSMAAEKKAKKKKLKGSPVGDKRLTLIEVEVWAAKK